jgi:hypothetical protein
MLGMFLISLDPNLQSIPGETVLNFLDGYLESTSGSTDDPERRTLRSAIGSRPPNEHPRRWPAAAPCSSSGNVLARDDHEGQ